MTLYVPDHFAAPDRDAILELIATRSFATLISIADGEPVVTHLPLVLTQDGTLLGHVARANPHAALLGEGTRTTAIFHGPHAYVSPTWYVTHPSVPTWNYAVAHAHGKARLTEEAELHEVVSELSVKYEAGNTPPWKLSEQPAAYVTSMLGMIVGFEIEVLRIEGKFKLSQNRPVEIPGVAQRLDAVGERELAAMMREHAPAPKSKITT